jgi:hypothetical protein
MKEMKSILKQTENKTTKQNWRAVTTIAMVMHLFMNLQQQHAWY